MKFLTLALVPLIFFAFFYVLEWTAKWAASKDSAFRTGIYMMVNMTNLLVGLFAIFCAVAFPFVTK